MSYWRYLCLFGSSLPPVHCRRAHANNVNKTWALLQLEVKTNQTNTNNVNKTWALLQLEVKTNQTNTNNVNKTWALLQLEVKTNQTSFLSRRGKNKNLTAHKSNSNTVWFNFQTKLIYIYIYTGTRYFYPPEIVYSTGRNYWTPQKLAVVKTTSTMVDRLVEYFS
jgi:hypothetical protein